MMSPTTKITPGGRYDPAVPTAALRASPSARSEPASPRRKTNNSSPRISEDGVEFVMIEESKILSNDTTPNDAQQLHPRSRSKEGAAEPEGAVGAWTPRALLCRSPSSSSSPPRQPPQPQGQQQQEAPLQALPQPPELAGDRARPASLQAGLSRDLSGVNAAGDLTTTTAAAAVLLASPSQHKARRGSEVRRAVTPERTVKSGRPILCPMLWSENELAAFLRCLGTSKEACRSVRSRTLRGVNQMVQMSNSELSGRFGLTTYVERHVVRKALTRFLELDRWQNAAKAARKLPDLMTDPALREFVVPLDELRVDAEISQGGFGLVYRGMLRPRVQRGRLQAGVEYRVAVKDMKGDRNLRVRELLKETRVMSCLQHPNMCMFIGICVDRSRATILSELMDCSLFDLVHQPTRLSWTGSLTLPTILRLSKGICAGIGYMHSKKLVHADLKSSNILIDFSSTSQLIPKICDFGHVAVRTHAAPHDRCGTPHWAAPEALRNEAVAPAADIFSFGVMLWEMLAQTLPHQSLTFAQVVGAVGWAEWLPDMDMLPEVPAGLRDLLLKCLKFAPAERPSIKEVREQVRQQLRGPRKEALLRLGAFFSCLGG